MKYSTLSFSQVQYLMGPSNRETFLPYWAICLWYLTEWDITATQNKPKIQDRKTEGDGMLDMDFHRLSLWTKVLLAKVIQHISTAMQSPFTRSGDFFFLNSTHKNGGFITLLFYYHFMCFILNFFPSSDKGGLFGPQNTLVVFWTACNQLNNKTFPKAPKDFSL